MNDGRQMEMHYADTGFPYTATESFIDLFQGFTHLPVNYAHASPMLDQVLLIMLPNSSCFFPLKIFQY